MTGIAVLTAPILPIQSFATPVLLICMIGLVVALVSRRLEPVVSVVLIEEENIPARLV